MSRDNYQVKILKAWDLRVDSSRALAGIAARTASAGTMIEPIGGCAQGQMSQRAWISFRLLAHRRNLRQEADAESQVLEADTPRRNYGRYDGSDDLELRKLEVTIYFRL
jgi:hypothetical protein